MLSPLSSSLCPSRFYYYVAEKVLGMQRKSKFLVFQELMVQWECSIPKKFRTWCINTVSVVDIYFTRMNLWSSLLGRKELDFCRGFFFKVVKMLPGCRHLQHISSPLHLFLKITGMCLAPASWTGGPVYLLCERLSAILLVSLDISSTSKPQNYSREDTTTRPLAQVYSDQLEKGILCIGQLHPTSRVLVGRLCGRHFLRHEEYTFPTAIFAVHMPKVNIF